MNYSLTCASVIDGLRQLASDSVQTVITSPPYWGLRSYGTTPQVWGGVDGCAHEWGEWKEIRDVREESMVAKSRTTDRFYGEPSRRFDGNHQKHFSGLFCSVCHAWLGEFGNEPTPELYIDHLSLIFSEIKRVLKRDGTIWLNLGDSYAGSWGNQGRKIGRGTQRPVNGDILQNFAGYGDTHKQSKTGSWVKNHPYLKPKDICFIPHRSAIRLQRDGWWCRQDIVWSKPNTMPSSVTDRCTRSHEYLFMFTKSAAYYYDQDAIKEPAKGISAHDLTGPGYSAPGQTKQGGNRGRGGKTAFIGQGHEREHENGKANRDGRHLKDVGNGALRTKRSVWSIATQPFAEAHFAVFPEKLVEPCVLAGSREGDLVLDPFAGAGTVGVVALRHGRDFQGIELNPEYVQMARRRIHNQAPLLYKEVA